MNDSVLVYTSITSSQTQNFERYKGISFGDNSLFLIETHFLKYFNSYIVQFSCCRSLFVTCFGNKMPSSVVLVLLVDYNMKSPQFVSMGGSPGDVSVEPVM